MIKLLLLGLFLYFIIRFVLRFVLPVAKMTASIKGAMKEMNKQNQTNAAAPPKATKAKPGDYIDYEMVK